MKHNTTNTFSYITLKGTFPYTYGNDNIFRIGYRRAQVLFSGHYTNYTPIKGRIIDWVNENKKQIKNAYHSGTEGTTIVILPFQSLFLSDLVDAGFFKFQIDQNQFEVIVSDRNINKINFDSLSKDLAREILLVLIVGITKANISSRQSNQSLVTALICAVCMGFIKGFVKSVSDKMIYKKIFTLNKMFSKCFSDVCAEVTTALCVRSCRSELYFSAYKGGLKGFFKYIFKHLIQRTTSLSTFTELSLEIFQCAFKAYLRAYSFSLLTNLVPSLIPMLCILPGALFGALLVNLFIVQCTL